MEISKPMMIDSFEILRSKIAKSIEHIFGCKAEHHILKYKHGTSFIEYKFTCDVSVHRKQLISIKDQFALIIGDIDSANTDTTSGVCDYQLRECYIILPPDEKTEKIFSLLALEYL